MVVWKKHYNKETIKFDKKKYKDNSKNLLSNNNRTYLSQNYFKSNFQTDLFKTHKNFTQNSNNKEVKGNFNSLLNSISTLENILLKLYQSCFYLMFNSFFIKQNFLVFYNIYFNFSSSNTNLQVSDSSGNSKLFYSAGLLDVTGKQKIVRKLVLNRLFSLLSLLKTKVIKNYPIALHLKNVGSYKFLIIKKLKRKFFVQLIKTFELKAYNGCRKKKEKRKR